MKNAFLTKKGQKEEYKYKLWYYIKMNYNLLYYTLGINIATHIILLIINLFKSSQDEVMLYKIVSYFMTFTLNVIIYTVILFTFSALNNNMLIIYIMLTIATLIIHFILDDDNLFRFNKGLTFLTTIFLVILLYGLFGLLTF